jgi:hypothetical protein
MSKLREGKASDLPREERAIAKLAQAARCNVYFGGASALVKAERLVAMGADRIYLSVVRAAYSSSKGEARDYLPYECPECGLTHLGESSAMQCCLEDIDYE